MKRTIALAVEDRAHETVIRALLVRIFSDDAQNLHDWEIVVLSNRGGRSLEHAYDFAKKCTRPEQACDLLVVASDANCSKFVDKRNEIQNISSNTRDELHLPCRILTLNIGFCLTRKRFKRALASGRVSRFHSTSATRTTTSRN